MLISLAKFSDYDNICDFIENNQPLNCEFDVRQCNFTQSWVRKSGPDGNISFSQYNLPIICKIGPNYFIFEGHHRIYNALKKNPPKSLHVHMFEIPLEIVPRGFTISIQELELR